MNKLNERLTLIANISVVLGIIFLAFELQQNTQAIQAQTRDSITEKQMEFQSWFATNPELAEAWAIAEEVGVEALSPAQTRMVAFARAGILREWENSLYQYQQGLFTAEDFEPRMERWRRSMAFPHYRDAWEGSQETYSPSLRAEIDRIVAKVGG